MQIDGGVYQDLWNAQLQDSIPIKAAPEEEPITAVKA